MEIEHYNKQLFAFLFSSPTPFHAVANIRDYLVQQGFHQLQETDRWQLEKGRSYLLCRESAAIIAFTLGSQETEEQGFRMLAAHTDSPCLQIKPRPEIKTGSFQQLGVEVYGGSLLAPWFDRDLSLAGRICCEMADGSLAILPINFFRPILTIPSIAIHLDREINKNGGINQQKHLPPIMSQSIDEQLPELKSLLMDQVKLEHPDSQVREILSFDLFCYDFQQPVYTGARKEFISSARLDNLLSCHAGMTAAASAEKTRNHLLFCANHEEIGSTSTTGANSSLLDSVLSRIIPNGESRRIAMRNSFLISMDNAHATHPNFVEKSDPAHEIHLNKGPVVKLNASQRYATNAITSAIFKQICKTAEVTPQEFVMRSDMPCGSTIGPMTSALNGLRTVDVGAASLAMHSIRELTGSRDPFLLYRAVSQFLKSDVHRQMAL